MVWLLQSQLFAAILDNQSDTTETLLFSPVAAFNPRQSGAGQIFKTGIPSSKGKADPIEFTSKRCHMQNMSVIFWTFL